VVVDDDDLVDLLRGVELGHVVRDRLRVGVARAVAEAGPRLADLVAAETERGHALLARDDPVGLDVLPTQAPLDRKRLAEDLRVERAGQSAIAGQREDRRPPHVPPLQQRKPLERGARARDPDHQLLHALGVRAHRLDADLGAPQLRGRDELHRARDLPRVLDRADAAFDVLDGRHALP
jgi:hypothetical protein